MIKSHGVATSSDREEKSHLIKKSQKNLRS
jgi:hypothetical protein